MIGEATIYRMLLPFCDEVLVTKVDADGNADVFLENLDSHPSWILVEEGHPVEDNGLIIMFSRYKNKEQRKL